MFNNEIQKQTTENNHLPLIIENTEIIFFILGEWNFYQLESSRSKNNNIFYSSKNEHVYLEKTLLIRSKYTNLELIGKHLNKSSGKNEYSSFVSRYYKMMSFLSLGIIFSKEHQNNVEYINFHLPSIDSKRDISYEFCWSGNYFSKKRHHPKLEKLFKIHGRNIIQSLTNQNLAELEINLAPILSFCESLNYEKERKSRQNKIMLILLGIYSMFFVIAYILKSL